MFLWDWISNIFSYFNFRTRNINLLILGLDNAGKTTLLHLLKTGKIAVHNPTLFPTKEELSLQNIHFTAYDLGGHPQVRKVWRDYYMTADAIVFIVDSCQHSRFEEAMYELQSILNDELTKDCPVLVLGNKVDKQGAISEQALADVLHINGLTTGKGKTQTTELNGRPLEIFMCSFLEREGYGDGFRWLANYV